MAKKKKTLAELRKAWSRGGKLGGAIRAERLTAEQRSEIARKAAAARYATKPLPPAGDSA